MARARRESGQDSRIGARSNGKSQTRIRPGFVAGSHRLEPDANQASIRGQEPGATVRARRGSGHDSRPGDRSNGKSQTRIRPGFEARSQEERQEPDAHQARIRGQRPGARLQKREGGRAAADAWKRRDSRLALARSPRKSNT